MVAARAFLTVLHDLHDPYRLHGMEQAVQRLVTAIRQGERIAIYGDYDVDGVTATALLVATFMSWASRCRTTFQGAPAKGMGSMLTLCDNSPVRGYPADHGRLWEYGVGGSGSGASPGHGHYHHRPPPAAERLLMPVRC